MSRSGPSAALSLALAASVLAAACVGEVVVPDGRESPRPPAITLDAGGWTGAPDAGEPRASPDAGPPPPVSACQSEAPVAVVADLRRMTRTQFENAVRELFGGLVTAPAGFPAPLIGVGASGYSNERAANLTSDADALAILEVAESVALTLTEPSRLPALLPCASDADRACAGQLVDTVGARAYRHRLTPEERAELLTTYDGVVSDGGGFREAAAAVVQTILLSPQFLFLVETGGADGAPEGGIALDPYSLATRLAATIWDSIPDPTLLDLAASGQLREMDTLAQQTRRMVADPRAAAGIGRFMTEWLMLGELDHADKDPERFPGFDVALARSMKEELTRLALEGFREGRTFEWLLTTSDTFVDRGLAAHYGLSDLDFSAGEWVKATLPDRRPGILTRAAVLSAHASRVESSYVRRGYTIRKRLLCETFNSPPADALTRQPEYPPDATGRERSEILRQVPDCAGCHILIDPVGLAFENFDAVGRWRDAMDSGRPIDPSGEVIAAADGVGGFIADADAFSARLASSETVRACFIRQLLRFVLGRIDGEPGDACIVERIDEVFAASGGRLDDLLVAMTTSDAFRFRRSEP